jgi:hypothetical protein
MPLHGSLEGCMRDPEISDAAKRLDEVVARVEDIERVAKVLGRIAALEDDVAGRADSLELQPALSAATISLYP